MFKMRVALVGTLALFITSGIAASAASAAGPIWKVNGSRFETGDKQIKVTNSNTLILSSEVSTTPIVVECKSSKAEGAFISGNGTSQGQAKGFVVYEKCIVTLKPAAKCEVVEPIKTSATKSHLVTLAGGTQIDELFEPTSGKTFVTLTLKECNLFNGPHEVTGSVAAVVKPEDKEGVGGELEFPTTPISSVKIEGGAAKEVKLSLGPKAATFSGSYNAQLFSGEKFGAFH